ncbi:MAG: cytidylate kinase family protein [Desulfofustis sp.]|nr:cytidylate kinase family protein [Desulfofustis sp.]
MAIITISRQKGSLGDEIARATAEKLGYNYIEKLQISEALARLGFSISEIDKFDEKKPSIWQTLSMNTSKFEHLIRAAVCEIAVEEKVVIVGRGGQVILKDVPGTVHLRIIAPLATRVARLKEQEGIEARAAERIIRHSDRDSSGYLSNYFDADLNDNNLYDLVINTRDTTLDTSVDLISCVVGDKSNGQSRHVAELLKDISFTQQAEAAFLEIEGVQGVNVSVEKGVASLSGLVRSSAIKIQCERALSNIRGIASVNNQINVSPENVVIF